MGRGERQHGAGFGGGWSRGVWQNPRRLHYHPTAPNQPPLHQPPLPAAALGSKQPAAEQGHHPPQSTAPNPIKGQRHNLEQQQRQGLRREQLMPLSRQPPTQLIFQMIQQSHPKKEETKRARVNLTAIGVTLKGIHFLFALLYFAVSFALAIMSKKCAQI